MTDEQKQKRRDYQRECYKKHYAAKKLNNNKVIDDSDKIIDDSNKIIDGSDNDNKIIADNDNDNKVIDDSDNDSDFYYISIIIKFLNGL